MYRIKMYDDRRQTVTLQSHPSAWRGRTINQQQRVFKQVSALFFRRVYVLLLSKTTSSYGTYYYDGWRSGQSRYKKDEGVLSLP